MKRKIALALAVVAVSSLGGGVYAHAKTTPVAYVSLDINPSVELGVNAFDQVISAEAYNEDGEKVLDGTNLVNSNVDDAVNTVISNAVSDGYVKEDGSSAIEITASTDKENVADKLEESLKESANKTLNDKNIKAEVETQNVALARRDEARQLGITPGKLNLIQKLQELDPTIKIEDYKSSSVKDIQKKAKELRKMNNIDKTTDDTTSTNKESDSTVTDTDAKTTTDDNISTDATVQENTYDQTDDTNVKKDNGNVSNKKDDSSIEKNKDKDGTVKEEKQNNNGKINSENKSNNREKNKNN